MHSVITDVSLSIHFANHSRHFISFLLFGHISSLCVVLKISGQRRVLCIIFCIVISFALSLIQNAILTIREVFWKPYHIVLEYGTPIEQTIALDKRIVLAFSCANSEHTEKDRMRKKKKVKPWNKLLLTQLIHSQRYISKHDTHGTGIACIMRFEWWPVRIPMIYESVFRFFCMLINQFGYQFLGIRYDLM